METVAFIFARGGSKGVPGKNLREIAGKPLVAHAIEQAKRCPSISDVAVSSDSGEILNTAVQFGAIGIKRPYALAQDDSPEFLAWKHAVALLPCDIFVNVPATCPLRSAEDIEDTIKLVTEKGADMAFTVKEHKEFVFGQGLRLPTARRQDLPKHYAVVGSCYVTTPKYINKNSDIWSGDLGHLIVPEERALDIDTEFDMRVAKLIMENA